MNIVDKDDMPPSKWCPGTPDRFHVWLNIAAMGEKPVYLCKHCNKQFKAAHHTIEFWPNLGDAMLVKIAHALEKATKETR